MKQNKVNQKDKEIFDYLYRFRFLNTRHIQNLLKHKNPRYTQELLKKLTDDEYLKRYYSRDTYDQSAKPAVYFLAPLTRSILKKNKDYDISELDKIYNAKNLSQKFIDHCLFMADLYLHFSSKKKKNEELFFFTEAELKQYDYFPENLPDGYAAIKGKRKAMRYFIDLIDPNTPPRIVRRRINEYITYQNEGLWEEGTGEDAFPSIVLICPTENMKKHIQYFARAKLEKIYNDELTIFLTTRDDFKNEWQKVE